MMSNPATRAKNKYNKNNYDQVKIWVPKGRREEINRMAHEFNMSRNEFILEAIDYYTKKKRKDEM